ncbi:MAG: hypothetical protein EOO12_04930 [Chitinophagaceae bacterium]|nr:MAG: hypothetical protein EOO12_04930 [Chitinophagaceae bacterium]
MRLLFTLLLAACLPAGAQQLLTNNEPLVALSGYQVVYKFFDNPVTISTGNRKGVVLSTRGGTLRKGKGPGQYYFRPDSTVWNPEIILRRGSFVRRIPFQARELPVRYFRIRCFMDKAGGYYNPFGENSDSRMAQGVFVSAEDFPMLIMPQVESFLVYRPSGDSTERHKNVGEAFDDTVLRWLRESKKGTTLTIRYVRVRSGGGAWIMDQEYPVYLAY